MTSHSMAAAWPVSSCFGLISSSFFGFGYHFIFYIFTSSVTPSLYLYPFLRNQKNMVGKDDTELQLACIESLMQDNTHASHWPLSNQVDHVVSGVDLSACLAWHGVILSLLLLQATASTRSPYRLIVRLARCSYQEYRAYHTATTRLTSVKTDVS